MKSSEEGPLNLSASSVSNHYNFFQYSGRFQFNDRSSISLTAQIKQWDNLKTHSGTTKNFSASIFQHLSPKVLLDLHLFHREIIHSYYLKSFFFTDTKIQYRYHPSYLLTFSMQTGSDYSRQFSRLYSNLSLLRVRPRFTIGLSGGSSIEGIISEDPSSFEAVFFISTNFSYEIDRKKTVSMEMRYNQHSEDLVDGNTYSDHFYYWFSLVRRFQNKKDHSIALNLGYEGDIANQTTVSDRLIIQVTQNIYL